MILSSSEAKPCLKKLARFVLYYIHFTLLPQLAAASSLLLVAAATVLSLGSQIWFHLNEHVQAAPAPLPGAPQYSQFPASTPSSQTGIQGQMNLPYTQPGRLHTVPGSVICRSPFAEPQLIRYQILPLARAHFRCPRGHDALLSMHSNGQ